MTFGKVCLTLAGSVIVALAAVAKLEAPYAGAYNYAIPQYEGAEYVFSLIFKDGDGNQIGEPYNAEYTIRCDFGSLFLLR